MLRIKITDFYWKQTEEIVNRIDTAWITLYPAMFMNLQDTVDICKGERVIVGEVPTGGVGFKSYQWSPTDSLQRSTSVKNMGQSNPNNLIQHHNYRF